MKSKTKVIILNEPFGYPKTPIGIYELIQTSTGELVPGQELARAKTKEEALNIIKRMGWAY